MSFDLVSPLNRAKNFNDRKFLYPSIFIQQGFARFFDVHVFEKRLQLPAQINSRRPNAVNSMFVNCLNVEFRAV